MVVHDPTFLISHHGGGQEHVDFLSIPRRERRFVPFDGAGFARQSKNLLALFGAELGGLAGAIDRYAPPLCTAIAVSLDPWVESVAVEGDAVELSLRLAAWAGAAVGLLVLTFRRNEISR